MQTLSDFYQSVFGCKTYKISLDAGCTCPNRDGTKGTGGCIFCSQAGSGDFVASRKLSIPDQIEQGKKLVESKLRGRSGERRGKFIVYFQSFTSTYGDPVELLEKYREALSCEGVVGLAVATRPDCLSPAILQGLAEISRTHFVQIELGLQTSNEKTGRLINRCYTNEDYIEAVYRIRETAPQIHIVTHLIFGLTNESEEDMLNSVRFVVRHASKVFETDEKNRVIPFGIKITSLYILKNTHLAAMYERNEYQPVSKEVYFSLLKKALPLLPENCIIHRLTGDPPKSLLIAPSWTTDKKRILNELHKLLNV
ncbi:TIGR01212 family radical SAM protein [Treponema bryantii]|uniref:TIGR01212 family radical SAM protein n=1 Tax=Treponema bryantii TaxID=163 RepID=UPI002B2FC727|nr:TIGR01212 family radical SAM protein [Treponema bryantii]